MEIWNWVWKVENDLREKGNVRLAEIIDDISSWTCADEHDKVDLIYPEAIALAKKENNRWIEVFIRHWYLQSQVLHRHNVKGMVREAVELLELSTQEDTKHCPQSICAVQDLANTYAKKDGPAYVKERIEVSEETLARINPSWPCFECIGDEYISALVDAGRLDEALQSIKDKRQQIIKAEKTHKIHAFCLMETRILIMQKKYVEAEKVIRAAENPGGGKSFQRYKSALTALSLAYQNKFEEATQFVLPFKEVLKAHSHFMYWAEYMYLAANNKEALNDDDLNYCFNLLTDKFIENGVQRNTLSLIAWHIELAFRRNDLFTVEHALEKAKVIICDLREDFGARDWYEKEMAKLNKEKLSFEIEVEIDDVNSEIENFDLTQLSMLTKQYPEHLPLFIVLFDKLLDNGFSALAYDKIKTLVNKCLLDPQIISRYGNLLIDLNKLKEFDNFYTEEALANFDEDQKIYAYWVISRRNINVAPERSISALKSILEIDANLENVLQKLANLLADQECYQEAADVWDQLIDIDKENNAHFHWDKMICDTMSDDWESVRKSARVLEIELDSEHGPIDENFGRIRVQLYDEQGNKTNLLAKRTGPVSATITGMRNLKQVQFFGDQIVFDATPLNKLDCKDDDGDACDSEGYYTYLYSLFRIKKKANRFIFDFDGIYPGDELWNKVLEVFTKHDCVLSVRSTRDYQVTDCEDGSTHDAVYCYIGTSENTVLENLNKELSELTKSFAYPFIWPRLASEVKDASLLELQVKHEERFGLG